MKAIIPVAGAGTRLKPHTLTKPKVLMNVAGKPMIHYIIEQLISEKLVNEIIMITGDMGEQIEHYLKKEFKFKFRFIEQKEKLGLGHAIHCAKEGFDKNEDALIILGDTLFDLNLAEICRNDYSVIAVKKVENPRRFGVVEKDENEFIKRFVEKPDSPEVSPSNEAIVGIYYLKNSDVLFSGLDNIIKKNIRTKSEYQLTDALSEMLVMNEKMKTFEIEKWFDCGKKETILSSNKYFLIKNKTRHSYVNSFISELVYIGKDVEIENSVIGDNVTIADGCVIKNSVIRNSIIDEHSVIENAVIDDSLIGTHSKVKKRFEILNIGDYSELD